MYFTKILSCLFSILFILGNIGFAFAETVDLEENSKKIAEAIRVAQASGGLSSITELTAIEEGDGLTVEIHGSDSLNYTAFKLLNPLRLVLDFNDMSQGDLTDRIEVNRGGVSFIHPIYIPEADVLRVEIALSNALAYDIQKRSNNQLAIKFSPITNSGGGDGFKLTSADDSIVDSCATQFSGEKEKISLDFQNANIKDIFSILSDISGYNLILAPDVSGSVNIRLLDVPWNVGLDIILKNNQLGRECDGNIIRIASQASIADSRETGLLVTEMVRVNYADLKETVATLSGMKSQRGAINVNERRSTIIITDIKQIIDDMKNVIAALDLPTPQVSIAARIVEVNSDSIDELGFSWGIDHSSQHDANFPALFNIGGETDRLNDPDFAALGPPGFNVDLPINGAAAGQLGLQFANFMGNTVLNVQLQALESRELARIISNPKITTLDNREAVIAKGRSVPFQTFSNTEGAEVEFLDGEVSLTVTPHITPDKRIQMEIAALNNNIVPTGLFVTVNTSEAFTTVLVNDGETTVIGGLYTDATSDASEGVPFFRDIPILGYFFANSIKSRNLDELLIFITPTIVKNRDL
jgi:type IV pilus assembly protein PilQ